MNIRAIYFCNFLLKQAFMDCSAVILTENVILQAKEVKGVIA